MEMKKLNKMNKNKRKSRMKKIPGLRRKPAMNTN